MNQGAGLPDTKGATGGLFCCGAVANRLRRLRIPSNPGIEPAAKSFEKCLSATKVPFSQPRCPGLTHPPRQTRMNVTRRDPSPTRPRHNGTVAACPQRAIPAERMTRRDLRWRHGRGNSTLRVSQAWERCGREKRKYLRCRMRWTFTRRSTSRTRSITPAR